MSQVWGMFLKDECGRRATCLICQKSISNTGTNTTNLWNHLKMKHKAKYYELDKLKRGIQFTEEEEDSFSTSASTLIASTSSQSVTSTICQKRPSSPVTSQFLNSSINDRKQTSMKLFTMTQDTKLKLDKVLAYTIAIDMMPYSVVNREGFQLYTRALCPSYKLPSRKTLTERRIPDLFKETKILVENILSDLSFFSLTTDCWTSVSNKPFMAITCHYVNSDFKLDNVCVGCQELNESHTSENLSDALQLMLLEFNRDIDKSIGAITTDHGANIVKAIKNISVPHIPCFGHSFNTAVKNVFKLEEVKPSLEKVKAIQTIFAYSWKAIKEMSIEQKRFDLKLVKFPSYSKTRWWSMLDLILVVISQEQALASFLRTYSNGAFHNRMIDGHDLKILKTLIHVLQPIRLVSDNLAGESYVTASAILPVITMVEVKLNEVESEVGENEINEIDVALKKKMLSTVVDLLHTRYLNNSLLKICSAVDPRFKFNYIQYGITDDEIKEILTVHCMEAWSHWITKSNSAVDEPPVKKKLTGLSAIFDLEVEEQLTPREITLEQRIRKEVDSYFQLPKVSFEQDPLIWWSLNSSMFPHISVLVRKVMCCQATSVASERVFSRAGNIVSDQRAALTEEHCSQLIFISMNKKHVKVPIL